MKYYFISCSILLNSVAFTYNVKLEDILSYLMYGAVTIQRSINGTHGTKRAWYFLFKC